MRQNSVLYHTFLLTVARFMLGCGAKVCPDVSLSTSTGVGLVQGLNCSKYLAAEGVGEMFMPLSRDLDSWPLCSELKPLNSKNAVQRCICPPGFTDAMYGDSTLGLGKIEGLKDIDIARISCKQACPAPYQSILRLLDVNACACWNRRGCVFEDRTLLPRTNSRLIQQSVMMLSDRLVSDSFIVNCRQSMCGQRVSPHDIMICSQKNIEYTYCNECPAECLKPHRRCTIHPTTRFCAVVCDPDFVRIEHTINGTYDCVARQVCPAHHYHNNSINLQGDVLRQDCVACPLGQDNANAYGEVCAVIFGHQCATLPCLATKYIFTCAVCDRVVPTVRPER